MCGRVLHSRPHATPRYRSIGLNFLSQVADSKQEIFFEIFVTVGGRGGEVGVF